MYNGIFTVQASSVHVCTCKLAKYIAKTSQIVNVVIVVVICVAELYIISQFCLKKNKQTDKLNGSRVILRHPLFPLFKTL